MFNVGIQAKGKKAEKNENSFQQNDRRDFSSNQDSNKTELKENRLIALLKVADNLNRAQYKSYLKKLQSFIKENIHNQDLVGAFVQSFSEGLSSQSEISKEIAKIILAVLFSNTTRGEVRKLAAKALNQLDDPSLNKIIIKKLDSLSGDKDLEIAIAGLSALKATRDLEAIKYLKELASSDPSEDLRIEALASLFSHGDAETRNFIAQRAVSDPNAGFAALPNLKFDRRSLVVNFLIKMLEHENPKIRRGAAMGLYGLDISERETIDRLVYLALHGNQILSQQIVVILKNANTEYAEKTLVLLSKKAKAFDARRAAMRATGS